MFQESNSIDLYRAITHPYPLEEIANKGITLSNHSTAQNKDWFDDMTDWGGNDPHRTVAGLPVFTNLGEAKDWFAGNFSAEEYERNRNLGKYAVIAHITVPLDNFVPTREDFPYNIGNDPMDARYRALCIARGALQLWSNSSGEANVQHLVPRERLAEHANSQNDHELEWDWDEPHQRDTRLSGEHFVPQYPHEALSDSSSTVVTQFYVPSMYLSDAEAAFTSGGFEPQRIDPERAATRYHRQYSLFFRSSREHEAPHPRAERADHYDHFHFPLAKLDLKTGNSEPI